MPTEQDKFKVPNVEGAFLRTTSRFLKRVSPEADAEFPAEAGRYRLYVSRACPWAHRTLVARALKGLEDAVPVTITGWKLLNLDSSDFSTYRGWNFDPEIAANPHGFEFIDQLYEHSEPGYRASFAPDRPKYSVPVLFDEKTQKIVSNESADIIMMFNSAFNAICKNPELELVPPDLEEAIESVNSLVYPGINDGVYRCGFALSQGAYDDAIVKHWEAMDRVEAILTTQPWLCGDRMTMADVRLFPTLMRYDVVYTGHFKTARRISEMPGLTAFMRRFLQLPGVPETCNLTEMARHYYWSHSGINPKMIVPHGPRQPPGIGDLITNDWGLNSTAAPAPEPAAGAWVRPAGRFQARVSAAQDAEFPAEAGRYRLYVTRPCPWAHRTLIVRALKGLEEVVPVTICSWVLGNLPVEATQEAFDKYRGWSFDPEIDVELHGFEFLDQLYEHACPGYREPGSKPLYSVPVLFDEKTQKIVSNESGEIVSMFNSEFNAFSTNPDLDLYPPDLKEEMEALNAWVYSGICDGVYKCGFAGTQEAYDAAQVKHWQAMDRAEGILSKQSYLVGDRLTMADVFFFPTMLRYDAVYVYHFKTAAKPIADMPGILRHTRMMLQVPGVLPTVNLNHIVRHYYSCQPSVNGTGIVPRGLKNAPGIGDIVENSFGIERSSL